MDGYKYSGTLFDVPCSMHTCSRQMALAHVVAVTIFAMLKWCSMEMEATKKLNTRTNEKSQN